MQLTDSINWSHPDYTEIYKVRMERLKTIRKTPGMAGGLKEFYKTDPVKFITDWGMTFDPRNAEIGLPTTIPFLLFPKQAEFIQWLYDKWIARDDGLAEKSRDMGVSWLCVAFAGWMWIFHPGTVVGFGSRKEEYVDKLGDPKSLFWKVRKFLALIPHDLMPAGYSEQKHAPHMRILNPENQSVIVGEAGDNIGRGNRTSIYFKDESAFYEHADMIDSALSMTSNCKIDVSTPNGNGNAFYRKRHSGKVAVFTFRWQDDPRKDVDWYKKQCALLDPVIIAQEIDIDYNASTTDAWISGDDVADAQSNGPADVQAIGGWIIGIDAAHFGDDESVIHARKGRLNLKQVVKRKLDGPQLAGAVSEFCRTLQERPIGIVIELDGPGVSCFDTLRMGSYSDIVIGIHTGARQADNVNYNLKAKLWRAARDYLADRPVSIDADPEFKSQICSVKYKYKDGLLIMQSKKEYKAELSKSPDRADAFVLTFYDVVPTYSSIPIQNEPTDYFGVSF